ncbi:UNVERIFIED_CONTAM: hypothetical protein NCL1_09583 [Trichonephila clavipes]
MLRYSAKKQTILCNNFITIFFSSFFFLLGLILGKIIHLINRDNRNAKLSQILRMYYSKGGILEKDEDLGQIWASFCNRETILFPLEQTLKDQITLYHLLVANGNKNIDQNVEYTWKYYQEQKTSVFRTYIQALNDYCTKEYAIDSKYKFSANISHFTMIKIISTTIF